MFNSVLMLCIGNVCRSPVAEGLLKDYSIKFNLGLTISSAGIQALVGQMAQPHSIEVAREHDIDISTHFAQQLTDKMVRDNELILIMDDIIRTATMPRFPLATGKMKWLGHFNQQEIVDPYRQPKAAFDTMYTHIDDCLKQWLEKVWKVDTKSA
jgi:protein-tyrosine phosphatase